MTTKLGWGGGVVPTLNAFENANDTRATVIIFDRGSHGDGIRMSDETVPTLQARMGTGGNNTPLVAYANVIGIDQELNARENLMGTLQAGADSGTRMQAVLITDDPTTFSLDLQNAIGTVRRLTPTECERLQGFPDGWTAERIDEVKGLVTQADSSRYKQMGNAVAVPCVEWIVNRLVAYEQVR